MKQLLVLLLIAPFLCEGQKETLITLPIKDGKVFYEKIYQDSGVSKNDFYVRAKNAFLRLFPATKDVIQNEDKENGIISGKGFFTFSTKGGGLLNMPLPSSVMATINIIVKDGKYKIEVFDFYKQAMSNLEDEGSIETFYTMAAKGKRFWQRYFINFNERVLLIFVQIKTEMNKKINTDF